MTRPWRFRRSVAAAAVLLAAGTLVLAATSAAATSAPTATATPSQGLRDAQVLTVRGAGFPPRTNIQILQCRGTVAHPPADERSCEGLTDDASANTDPRGEFVDEPGDPTGRTAGYRVAVLPTPRFQTTSIECGSTAPCVLYVGTQPSDFSQPHTFVGLAFTGAKGSGRPGWVVWVLAALALGTATAALVAVLARRRSTPAGRRPARRGTRG